MSVIILSACSYDSILEELYFRFYFFWDFLFFAGPLLLVLRQIPLETMIFVYWKHHGTLTVILIWESFLLTQFLGKLIV